MAATARAVQCQCSCRAAGRPECVLRWRERPDARRASSERRRRIRPNFAPRPFRRAVPPFAGRFGRAPPLRHSVEINGRVREPIRDSAIAVPAPPSPAQPSPGSGGNVAKGQGRGKPSRRPRGGPPIRPAAAPARRGACRVGQPFDSAVERARHARREASQWRRVPRFAGTHGSACAAALLAANCPNVV